MIRTAIRRRRLSALAGPLLLAACSQPPNLVVLRLDDDGQIGRAAVTQPGGVAELTRLDMAARNDGDGTAGDVASLSDGEIVDIFAGAMAAQPPKPAVMIVFFGVGSVEITPDSAAALADAVKAGQLKLMADISVVGHADPSGSLAQNLALSQRRAEGVRKSLVAAGIDPAGIEASAVGAAPSGKGGPAEGKRAVEIIIR